MNNREKVIKAFRTRIISDSEEFNTVEIPVGEAAQILELLKEQGTTLEKDGHHVRCLNCGEYWCDSDREGNPFPMNFCPNCGKKIAE